MTDKELRRLGRAALLDLLIEQMEKNEQLELKISKLERQLKNRTMTVSSTGSMAEAAQELKQYMDNIRAVNQHCDEIIEQAKKQAAAIISEAQSQAREIRSDAQSKSDFSDYTYETPTRAPRLSAPQESKQVPRQSVKSSEKSRRSTEYKSEYSAKEDNRRKTSGKKRDPVIDPFSDAPLDDTLDRAFSEMRRRNSR